MYHIGTNLEPCSLTHNLNSSTAKAPANFESDTIMNHDNIAELSRYVALQNLVVSTNKIRAGSISVMLYMVTYNQVVNIF